MPEEKTSLGETLATWILGGAIIALLTSGIIWLIVAIWASILTHY